MNFYVVFCKNKKKFDKYVKVNRIKNKVIIDIKEQLDENQIKSDGKYKDFFNLLIYTKISQSLKKGKDIYYIPNFYDKTLNVDKIINIKNFISNNIDFNILMFFDEFNNDNIMLDDIINNLDNFDNSQIIKDY